jgi:hypothetical protein
MSSTSFCHAAPSLNNAALEVLMNRRFRVSLLLMLILMFAAHTGCPKPPDAPPIAPTRPAAAAINHTPPVEATITVPGTVTPRPDNVKTTKDKTAERSADKGPPPPVAPPSPTQLALQLVIREWDLQDRLKATQDESARTDILAEIEAVRQQRQSLYQRLHKGQQP